MLRRTLDWKLWMSLMLAGLAELHNSTPYVHVGVQMALYIFILLIMDSFDEQFYLLKKEKDILFSTRVIIFLYY